MRSMASLARCQSCGSLPRFSAGGARSILSAFDVDEDSRDFLAALIAADGGAPPSAVQDRYAVSLMRCVEEWDMLLQCAASLRDHAVACDRHDQAVGSTLLPYIGAVLSRAGEGEPGPGPGPPRSRRRAGGTEQPGPASRPPPGKMKKTAHGDAAEERAGKRRLVKTESPFWDTRTASSVQDPKRGPSMEPSGDSKDAPGGTYDRSATLCGGRLTATPVKGRRGDSERSSRKSGVDGGDEKDDRKALKSPLRRQEKKAEHKKRSGLAQDLAIESQGAVSVTEPTILVGNAPAPDSGGQTQTPIPDPLENKRIITAKSPYFIPSPSSKNGVSASPRKKSRPPRGTVSGLPFPALSAERFGLVQEELAHNPFQLLIAVTFLIRTSGKAALPVLRKLLDKYPTPEDLAAAAPEDIITMIRHLGLGVVRCAAVQKYARRWIGRPPTKHVRFGVKNYPRVGGGKDVRAGEEFGPEDESFRSEDKSYDGIKQVKRRGLGSAWEIGHLTQGPYAIDSWRIFCRDVLLGRADDWLGRSQGAEFQPEWMRVLPEDKELRTYLRWMWMREGWEWDPLTGEREVLREEMRTAVNEGRVAYDDKGQLQIQDGDVHGVM